MSRHMLPLSYIASRSGVAVSLSALVFFVIYCMRLRLASVTVPQDVFVRACVILRKFIGQKRTQSAKCTVLRKVCKIHKIEKLRFLSIDGKTPENLHFLSVLVEKTLTAFGTTLRPEQTLRQDLSVYRILMATSCHSICY